MSTTGSGTLVTPKRHESPQTTTELDGQRGTRSHPTLALSHPIIHIFPTVREGRATMHMTTTKTCTDARGTVRRTQNGVTHATATDSRQTECKSSLHEKFAHIFDPRGVSSEALSPENGPKTRRTRGSALRRAERSHRSRELVCYEPVGGKSHAADSIFIVSQRGYQFVPPFLNGGVTKGPDLVQSRKRKLLKERRLRGR